MRIIHTADLHLGATLPRASQEKNREREMDFLKNLEIIVRKAIELEADLLLIAGDVFHKHRPRGYLLDEFSRMIGEATSRGINVLVVAGNHDIPPFSDDKPYLSALESIRAPNYHFSYKPELRAIETRDGRNLCIICLPYRRSSYYRSDEEKSKEFKSRVSSKLDELLDEARRLDPDYVITVAHFTIEGARISEGSLYARDEVVLGRRHIERDDVSYVALGHIHMYQVLDEKLVYSGSIERVDFGEIDETKGFVLVEERGGDLEHEFLELPSRPMVRIPRRGVLNLLGSKDPTKDIILEIERAGISPEAVLKIVVKLGTNQSIDPTILSKSLNVFYWFVEEERVIPRERFEELARPNVETIYELFDSYVDLVLSKNIRQFNLSPEDLEEIRKEGKEAIRRVEEEI